MLLTNCSIAYKIIFLKNRNSILYLKRLNKSPFTWRHHRSYKSHMVQLPTNEHRTRLQFADERIYRYQRFSTFSKKSGKRRKEREKKKKSNKRKIIQFFDRHGNERHRWADFPWQRYASACVSLLVQFLFHRWKTAESNPGLFRSHAAFDYRGVSR